jgi:hypothetical protein
MMRWLEQGMVLVGMDGDVGGLFTLQPQPENQIITLGRCWDKRDCTGSPRLCKRNLMREI